jgi:glutamyl/glutaminyl-tRNA synthetase
MSLQQAVRVILTGRVDGPSLYTIMEILGRDEVNRRIDRYLNG